MKYVVLLCVLFLAGCDSTPERYYDHELKVYCWKTGFNKGGIFCIPEWQLEDPYSKVDPNETPDYEG